MNPISKALFDIKWQIPAELLQQAFVARMFDPVIGPAARQLLPVSIDHLIRQHVIEAKVIVDTNLVGGPEVSIPLSQLIPDNATPYLTVYRVPKILTQGRVITRVLSITIGQGSVMGTTNMGLAGASPMLDAAAQVLTSHLPVPLVSTAYVQMIGENTFLIDDNMLLPNNTWMRCSLESDTNFNHLQQAQWLNFSELCTLATKAFIYNKLVIEVGMAQLVGGQELGKFKEVLDGYADANENYLTYLRSTWKVSQFQSDPDTARRHARMLLGGQVR